MNEFGRCVLAVGVCDGFLDLLRQSFYARGLCLIKCGTNQSDIVSTICSNRPMLVIVNNYSNDMKDMLSDRLRKRGVDMPEIFTLPMMTIPEILKHTLDSCEKGEPQKEPVPKTISESFSAKEILSRSDFGSTNLSNGATDTGSAYRRSKMQLGEFEAIGQAGIDLTEIEPNPQLQHGRFNYPTVDYRNSFSLDTVVTKLLLSIDVPPHVKGYKYLREAIIMVMQDSTLLYAMTKRLYPAIAKKCDSTPARVERAIRHAIEISWSREGLARLFSSDFHRERRKPANSELIATIVDIIKIKSVYK